MSLNLLALKFCHCGRPLAGGECVGLNCDQPDALCTCWVLSARERAEYLEEIMTADRNAHA